MIIGLEEERILGLEETFQEFEKRGDIKKEFDVIDAFSAKVPEKNIEKIENAPGVDFVEPNYTFEAHDIEIPWGVDKTFEDNYYFEVWDNSRGSSAEVLVLDTGVDEDHTDLNVAGGINTVDDNDWFYDNDGHGTHIAGTIGALDNNSGVVGIAPEAKLYSGKVLDDEGRGTVETVVEGIEWGIKNDIPIMNMSFGTEEESKTVKEAVYEAHSEGHLLIGSAGNEGEEDSVNYPAKYDPVIAVSAFDQNEELASFSSMGEEVELTAPGVEIYSTYPDNAYSYSSGTSMAAPHITGVSALMFDENPELDNKEMRKILQDAARDMGFNANQQGYGRVLADDVFDLIVEEYDIKGSVKDKSGDPIEDVSVVIEEANLEESTDKEGIFKFVDIEKGEYTITATKERYKDKTKDLVLEEDQNIDLVLEEQGRVKNVSSEEEFNTIQAAIDEAAGGDIIEVREGTYEDNITIEVKDLTLKAAEEHKATIEGKLYVGANDLTIKGFDIQSPEKTAISNISEGLELNANKITADEIGVSIDAGDIKIIDNEFYGLVAGIEGAGEDNVETKIKDNNFEGLDEGIKIADSADWTNLNIENNGFKDNKIHVQDYGADVELVSILEDNVFPDRESVVTANQTIEDVEELTEDIADISWDDDGELTINEGDDLEVDVYVELKEVDMAFNEERRIKAIDNVAFFYTIEHDEDPGAKLETEEFDTRKGYVKLYESLENGIVGLELDEFNKAGIYNLELHAGVLKQ